MDEARTAESACFRPGPAPAAVDDTAMEAVVVHRTGRWNASIGALRRCRDLVVRVTYLLLISYFILEAVPLIVTG